MRLYVRSLCTSYKLKHKAGYDCLGLCLDLFNKFTFEEELESGLQFEGCDEAFASEDNLVYKTMLSFMIKLNRRKFKDT